MAERAKHYYDWEDAYFRTGVYQTYDLAVSGGNETTSYYTSLAYTKDKGRVFTNEFERISGRVNVKQKVGGCSKNHLHKPHSNSAGTCPMYHF